MILKYTEIKNRARTVLGISKNDDLSRIKYARSCMILKHHPDRNQENPHAEEVTALINEAYSLIIGKIDNPTLLENDSLVALVTENPITHLDNIPTYEEWLRNHFYDKEGIIWPESAKRSTDSKSGELVHTCSYEDWAKEQFFGEGGLF